MRKILNESGTILKVKTQKTAVALKYPEGAEVPFITAKGKGELAQRILEEAEKCGVHIEKNDSLVNLLAAEEINAAVPEEAFEALAAIFAFVLSQRED